MKDIKVKEKGFKIISVIVVALSLSFPLFYFPVFPYGGGDDIHYLLLAKSIAHRHAYLDIYLPEEPPHTQYPPGWPLLLSPLAVFFKDPLVPAKIFLLILSFLTIFLGLKFMKGIKDHWLGLGGFIMLFMNVSYWGYSGFTLSDLPFLLFVMLYMLAIQSSHPRATRVSLFIAVASFYIRTVGIALVLGHIFYMWFLKRKRPLFEGIFIGIPAILLWPLRNFFLTGSAASKSSYLSSFLLKDPYTPDLGKVSVGELIVRPINNLYLFATKSLPNYFFAFSTGSFVKIIGVVLAILILFGLINLKKRKSLHRFLPFALFYFPIYLMWPEVWNERRFLLPLMPLLVVLILEGSRFLFLPFKKVKEIVPFLVGGLFFFVNFYGVASHTREIWRLNVHFLKRDYQNIESRWWAEVIEASSWVKDSTSGDAVFFIRKPRVFSYFSQRHCVNYPYTRDMKKMWSVFEKYKQRPLYLVYIKWIDKDKRYIRPFLQSYLKEGYIKPVFRDIRKKFYILRFVSFPEEGS